jgi:hypothetical protein
MSLARSQRLVYPTSVAAQRAPADKEATRMKKGLRGVQSLPERKNKKAKVFDIVEYPRALGADHDADDSDEHERMTASGDDDDHHDDDDDDNDHEFEPPEVIEASSSSEAIVAPPVTLPASSSSEPIAPPETPAASSSSEPVVALPPPAVHPAQPLDRAKRKVGILLIC